MGMNAVVFVHCDALGTIQDEPKQVVDGICSMILAGKEDYLPVHGERSAEANPIKVMRMRHADETVLYAMWGNTLVEVTRENLERHPGLRRNLVSLLRYAGFVVK